MTLLELLTEWRRRLDDRASPPLWSKEEGANYLTQAIREACERARLIHDAVTPSVCNIAGRTDVGTYKLHPSIIEITSCSWNGRFLRGISRFDLDDSHTSYRRHGNPYGSPYGSNWGYQGYENTGFGTEWAALNGTPTHFVDPQEKYLTLVRIPTQDAPIHLTVYRYQVEPFTADTADDEEPELADRHHYNLVDWMERLAYLKRDSETYNPKAAEEAEARFVQSFGPKIDADTRRTQRGRKNYQVRLNPDW